jgi:hypothetical protein
VRHQPDEFSKTEKAGQNLQNAHQHDRREEILNAVLGDQGDHDNGKGAGGAGNHAASPANRRRNQSDNKSGIETDQRMNPGDKGKGDRFRNQRQRDGKAGKHFDFDAVEGKGGKFGIVQIGRR